ncbi:hypothetical protein CY35_13G058800 [Sphagnum magellanicum]|nr:hypothetical protein CY35_13G058800 [Sphagnum magellanicum]
MYRSDGSCRRFAYMSAKGQIISKLIKHPTQPDPSQTLYQQTEAPIRKEIKLPGKRMGVCKGFCGCVRETLSAAAQQAGGALRREAGKDFWREFGSQRFHVHESCVSRKTLLRLELVPASKEGRKEGRNLC